MYDAAGWASLQGRTERVFNLLQLIVSTGEIRGENRLWQFANRCWELIVSFA